MRKMLILLIAGLVALQTSAQDRFKKNTFYFEIAGNGIVLSVNYERQVGTRPGFGYHIGVGLGGYNPAIPLGATYLFDLGNKKSFIETGLGITLAELDLWDDKHDIHPEDNPYKAGFIPSVGYRHQTKYGLVWKLIYSPVFSKYRSMPLYGGVSIGWTI